MRIRKLNIKDLQRSDVVWDYYERNYNFTYASYEDGRFTNIPVLEKTSNYLSDNKINIPEDYIQGFIKEYEKPLPQIKSEDDRQWLLRNILPDFDYIPRNFFNDFFELGCKTAEAFKTWEYIIPNLNNFEKYFTGEVDKPKPHVGFIQSKTFESLFRNPKAANAFYKEFIELKYYLNNKWKGISGNKGELLAAYCVLKERNILIPGKPNINEVITFYKKFGLIIAKKGGYLTESFVHSVFRGEILLNGDKDIFKRSFRELIAFYSS